MSAYIEACQNGKIVNNSYIIFNPITNQKEILFDENALHRKLSDLQITTSDTPDLSYVFAPFISNLEKSRKNIEIYNQWINMLNADTITLGKFCKNELSQFDFSSVPNLINNIDSSNVKYIELVAVVERAILEWNYDFNKIKDLFLLANDSRLQLAIMESLPVFFKDTNSDEDARKLLTNIAFDFSTIRDDDMVGWPKNFDELYIGKYRLVYDEDSEQFDSFMTATIFNLAKFGHAAEDNLLEIFEQQILFDEENENENEKESNNNIDNNGIPLKHIDEENSLNEGWYENLIDGADIDGDGDLLDNELKSLFSESYAYNVALLEALSEVGGTKSIDYFISFVKTSGDSSYIYKKDLMEIFNKINATYSAGGLLDLLKNNNKDIRSRAGKFLFSLEIGQIGISTDGVHYLEKVFDLGALNDPEFFVKRLSANGDIGIFDKNKTLQKRFVIRTEDLVSKATIIHPKVLEFTYETLFYSKEGETEEERVERERYLKEFKENYFGFYDEEFFNKTGVRFNNLDLKEQGQFLIYYKRTDFITQEKLFEFVKKYGENGLKTFLSLEQGGKEMGEKILKIGENLDEQKANLLFIKYAEMVDKVRKVNVYIIEQLGKHSDAEELAITEQLLIRGKKLLDIIYEITSAKDNPDGHDKKIISKIFQKISTVSSDVELFKITVQNTKKNDRNILEKMKDAKIITLTGNEILYDKQILLQLQKIIEENNSNKTIEFKNALWQEFTEHLKQQNSKVHLITYKEQVISFLIVQTNGLSMHVSGFNADPQFQEIAPGSFMLNNIIEEYARRGYTLKAEADLSKSNVYINKRNFVATGWEEFAGKKYLLLERNDKIQYSSKLINRKEIREALPQGKSGANWKIFTTDKQDNFPPQLNAGWVITKILLDQKKNMVHYILEEEKVTPI